MHNRTQRLRDLMAQHNLTADAVAHMLGRTATTVAMWRCRTGVRVIPDTALQLLEFKLGAAR